MKDKVLVGTVPNGSRFFSVEREGRKMPLLNGAGEVATWTKQDMYKGLYSGGNEFQRVLQAMKNPDRLKVVEAVRVS